MARITIYVRDNCPESARALDIASYLKNFAPNLEIKLVNLSHEDAPEAVKGSDGPVYEIGGKFFRGNPRPEELRELLKLFAATNTN